MHRLWVRVIEVPEGGGGSDHHIFIQGGPILKSDPIPFYIPFLTKKVPIPFYCCKCTVFQIWINHKNRKFVFSTFSQPWNVSVGPFGPFNCPKWQIFLPFHILQLVKSLPFHIPEAWKRYPFRVEPPCIGHCREYHPPPWILTRLCWCSNFRELDANSYQSCSIPLKINFKPRFDIVGLGKLYPIQ